ncbi:MAG: efflux RND transporter permease subunit [Caulobacterales bacterium]|uniref:efflux RND transporter permease subunit n=1 Tax=Glycocaulis sp. TaxID=1969725 RepID=UPI003F9F5846
MSTLFFRFPRLTGLVLFLMLAAGFAALATMGRQEDPYLTERFGRVVTFYPGADAERVEALLSEPVERSLMELAEVEETNSVSRANISSVSFNIREDLSETEVEQAWTKIREQVASVRGQLPAEAGSPEVVREYMGAASIIVAVSWPEGSDASIGALGRLARELEDRLRGLGATYRTEVFGAPEEEIRVVLDPEAAAALGINASDVAMLLARSDARAPAGRLAGEGYDFTVEVDGAFDSLDRVRDVALSGREGQGFIRLGDIATVERARREPDATQAYFNDTRSILVAAFIQPDRRVDTWGREAARAVETFEQSVPGLDVEIVFSQTDYVERRLNGLAINLGYSALIVFAVLFVMMGWRSALIVGSALPLTILLVLVLTNLYGQPLHQMSVTGLVVALGLLIDNAIVVVDDYRLLRRRGLDRMAAVDKAVRTLFAPLLASTATTVFAFAPIALMPGSAGEFISMIGVSVIFAVTASFALAFTVIIALAAWFDDHDTGEEGARPFWRDGLRSRPLAGLYRRLLDAVIAQPAIGMVLAIILPVTGFLAVSTLPSQFFPPTERDMFEISVTLPSGVSMAETRRRTEAVTAMLREYEGVEDVGWVLGGSSPRVYYNMRRGQAGRPNYAAGWVRTRSPDATRAITQDFQARAREAFPDTMVLATPFEQGPPTPAPIELKIIGPELAVLDALGQDIRRVLASTPGVTYTQAQLLLGEPVARLSTDEASAALAGLRLGDVAGRVRADLDGVLGGTVIEGVEVLPVRVIGPSERREAAANISAVPLAGTGRGAMSTVGALGDLTLVPQTASIIRIDGERANPVYGYLSPFVLPAPVLETFFARLDAAGIEMPPGYRLVIGGEAESQGEATADLMSTAIPLLILMVGSVVLAFNSFRYAGVVFVTGFLSVGLALFGVWLFGTPLGFNAIVGSMGLVGLSINGTIVVLSALRNSPEALQGDPEAIRETVMDATRHILATTLTTIGGFAPLLIEGDPFWLPFASAVAGGVAGSAMLALIFAPAAFVLLVRLGSAGVRPLPVASTAR